MKITSTTTEKRKLAKVTESSLPMIVYDSQSQVVVLLSYYHDGEYCGFVLDNGNNGLWQVGEKYFIAEDLTDGLYYHFDPVTLQMEDE